MITKLADPLRPNLRSPMLRVLVFFMLMSIGSAVLAASFDCGKASEAIEKLICGNEELSKLDSQMGSSYQLAVNDSYPILKSGLMSEQKKWIIDIRNKCKDAGCLVKEYKSRINDLVLIKTDSVKAEYVVDSDEFSHKISDFRSDVRSFGLGENLTSCRFMIHLIQGNGDKDPSYGAVCSLGAHNVMICNDTMIGRLTVTYGFTANGAAAAKFTEENCPSGG